MSGADVRGNAFSRTCYLSVEWQRRCLRWQDEDEGWKMAGSNFLPAIREASDTYQGLPAVRVFPTLFGGVFPDSLIAEISTRLHVGWFFDTVFCLFFFGFSNRILTLHLFDAYRTLMQTRSQDCVFLGGAQLQCLGRYISSTTILLSPASIVNCFSYRV